MILLHSFTVPNRRKYKVADSVPLESEKDKDKEKEKKRKKKVLAGNLLHVSVSDTKQEIGVNYASKEGIINEDAGVHAGLTEEFTEVLPVKPGTKVRDSRLIKGNAIKGFL